MKKRSKESGAVVRQIREKEGKGRREEGGSEEGQRRKRITPGPVH